MNTDECVSVDDSPLKVLRTFPSSLVATESHSFPAISEATFLAASIQKTSSLNNNWKLSKSREKTVNRSFKIQDIVYYDRVNDGAW